jgi:hypothetical protein
MLKIRNSDVFVTQLLAPVMELDEATEHKHGLFRKLVDALNYARLFADRPMEHYPSMSQGLSENELTVSAYMGPLVFVLNFVRHGCRHYMFGAHFSKDRMEWTFHS